MITGKEKEEYVLLANQINELEKHRELGRILRTDKVDDLIEQIEEDLRYYPKNRENLKIYSNHLEEQVYSLSWKQDQNTNQYFADVDQFLSALSLCQSIEDSEKLASSFLWQLNINENRRLIIRHAFTLHKNNNLAYICRVLALINTKEKEINVLIEEKVKTIKGWEKFVKVSPILTELIKLKVADEDKILDLLLRYVEEMDF